MFCCYLIQLYAAFCMLSSVFGIITLSSATNNIVSDIFGCGIPFMSSFCHLVVISSKCVLNGVQERGQLLCTFINFHQFW